MSQRLRRRALVVSVAIAVIGGVSAVALPALAEDTGSITGHYTRDGAPVSASVALYDADLNLIQSVIADETGGFSFAGLDPGDYRLGFFASTFRQFAVQKTELDQADAVTVVAGQTTVVEEEMVATGAVSGLVTNPDGSPAANIRVTLQPEGPGSFLSMPTDVDGTYEMPFVLPGDYRVSFSHDFVGPTQFAHGKVDFGSADIIAVTAGTTTIINEQLFGSGTLSGDLTTADGAPVPFVGVIATRAGEPRSQSFGFTDSAGHYRMPLFDGDYTLQFNTPYGLQWATGRLSADEADLITVAGDTTHNETLVPFGRAEVRVRNRATGAPVTTFCASAFEAGGAGSCTETGVATLDLLPGPHGVSVFALDAFFESTETHVTIESGIATSVTVDVDLAASVATTMVDKESGAPVENACLELVPVIAPTSLGNSATYCSDATGAVLARPVTPGTYVAFVWANDGVHGHQWVGNGSGKGEFEKARTFTVGASQAVTLPRIKLDKAGGDLTGTVTDEATGAPVQGFAGLSSFNAGLGPGAANYALDEQGHYTISGLGPYQWTLFYAAFGYAYEWSGDSATRAKAKTVKVSLDGPTTANVTVGPGTTVSGLVTGPDGTPVDSGRITFVNADSRDEIGVDDLFDATGAGQYEAHIKGTQRVKIAYYAQVGDLFYSGYVGGATFEEATTFTIPSGGSLTINIPATHPAPL